MRLAVITQLSFAFPTFSGIGLATILLLIISTSTLTAQAAVPNLLDTEFKRLNFKDFDLKLSEPSTKDRMICEKWCDDRIITMVDTLEVKYNFDFSESLFYINMNDKVFSIKSDFIKSFIIDNKTYINYRKPQSSEAMILELLVNGDYVLYKHHSLIYRAPDFDPILNVGNKEGYYKKTYEYYAFCNERLINLPSQVKKTIKKLHQECDTPKVVKVKGDIVDLFNKINNIEQ